jgi:hypothetical protein
MESSTKGKKRTALERRHDDPILTLHHRFYNTVKRRWPDAPRSLYAKEVVQRVYQKFQGKSQISGESDYRLLCIFAYPSAEPPAEHQLILVTSREAQALARQRKK